MLNFKRFYYIKNHISNIKMTPSDSEGKKKYIKKLKKIFTLLTIHFCYVILHFDF